MNIFSILKWKYQALSSRNDQRYQHNSITSHSERLCMENIICKLLLTTQQLQCFKLSHSFVTFLCETQFINCICTDSAEDLRGLGWVQLLVQWQCQLQCFLVSFPKLHTQVQNTNRKGFSKTTWLLRFPMVLVRNSVGFHSMCPQPLRAVNIAVVQDFEKEMQKQAQIV